MNAMKVGPGVIALMCAALLVPLACAETRESSGDAAEVGVGAAADTPPPAAPPQTTADGKQALLNPSAEALRAQAPDSFRVRFETSKGNFTVMAHRDWAPIGVDRFHYLVSNGFYDEVRFFRVIPGFMVQFGISGDPAVSAKWSGMSMQDDPVKVGNKRGNLTYAKTRAPNSRSTQLFINYVDNDRLDADGFAAIGRVVEGMNVVESLYSGYGGTPSNSQGAIQAEGNDFLAKNYPQLDYIITARVMQ